MSNKTIFFLINSLESGGAERVISNILPALSKKYKIYLILLKDSRFYDLPKNIKVISFSKIKNNILMIPLFPFYIWKLKKLIKKHRPHKVISFLEIANFVNILADKNAIISFRISLNFFDKGTINRIYKILIKLLYPKAEKIVVNSRENKQDLIKKLDISPNKIQTIYNPIDLPLINKLKNNPVNLPFSKNSNHKIFITVGRLDSQKNISTLIKSFKNLSPENRLLIIGDGPEKNNLINLIQKYNLNKQVFLLGKKKNVYKYLNIADYFIFSSRAEGFPNVLIEAMACNLPIITSDFKTGAREIIDPNLKFDTKIKYPYYGPNGILLSLVNFEKDFSKINFSKITQKRLGLDEFKTNEIAEYWKDVL